MEKTQLYFNYGDYGVPEWRAVNRAYLGFMYKHASEMIEKYPPDVVDTILDEKKLDLINQAAREIVNDYWFYNATFLMAFEGLLHGKELKYCFFDPDV